MEKNIINNTKNMNFTCDDIKNIIDCEDNYSLNELFENARKIQEKFNDKTQFETNLYFPDIYRVKDNCPTCGYRTPESRREYNPLYIKNILEYRLRDINQYDIHAINCYFTNTLDEDILKIVMNTLDQYDVDINVNITNWNDYKLISCFDVDSLIIDYSLLTKNYYTHNNLEEFDKISCKISQIINDNLIKNITYEFPINIGETHIDLYQIFKIFMKIKPTSIEIKGYDPFYDSPEEYNPHYSQQYLKKIISILRIILPKTNLKLKYATNGNNDMEKNVKLGINTITGVYFDKNKPQLYNIDKIMNIKS